MVVNRQRHMPNNEGLRDGGKEFSVGGSNKYDVLKLLDEDKEWEIRSAYMIQLVHKNRSQILNKNGNISRAPPKKQNELD